MEWPVTVVKNLSFSRLEAGACLIGNDLLVGIKGGDLHHIGTGGFHVDGSHLTEMYVLAALVVVSAFYKHRANIGRLLHGTENKLSVGKSK